MYGGGLDYKDWYNTNKVKILCAGLDYYCYQTVKNLPPFFNHKIRATYSKVETVNDAKELEHPAIREVILKYGNNLALEISHIGDLPAKSGIGSSSSFTVGLINSISTLQGKYIGKNELAIAAINLEQKEMQENVGIQDQCAAAYGGLCLIKAYQDEIVAKRFICSSDYKKYIEENLLLGFNGLERFSGVSAKKTISKLKDGTFDGKLKELSMACAMGIDEFSKESDIAVHATLTKSCRDIKKTLNGDENNSCLESIIETSERAGSLCTRTIGAGGGGFFVCWAPKHKHKNIKEALPKIKTWVDVKFSNDGSQVIFAS